MRNVLVLYIYLSNLGAKFYIEYVIFDQKIQKTDDKTALRRVTYKWSGYIPINTLHKN
jgi:hypothetical protein